MKMGLTVKRDDKLTSLFDKFATVPEDKKKKLKAQEKATSNKKQDK